MFVIVEDNYLLTYLPLPLCIFQLFEIRKQKQNTSILETLIG